MTWSFAREHMARVSQVSSGVSPPQAHSQAQLGLLRWSGHDWCRLGREAQGGRRALELLLLDSGSRTGKTPSRPGQSLLGVLL